MIFSTEFFGIAASLISLAGTFLYMASILRGQSKPHVFTHLVWGIIAGIGFFAQLHDHAGPAAWTMGVTTISCLANAALALRYGEKTITRGDWIAFIASLSAIVPWILTKDPLGSVVLICVIDVVAFYPTCRKSWNKPWDENLTSYNIASLKFLVSFAAMENVTLTTALYPAVVLCVNVIFAAVCYLRRRDIPRPDWGRKA